MMRGVAMACLGVGGFYAIIVGIGVWNGYLTTDRAIAGVQIGILWPLLGIGFAILTLRP